MLLEKVLFDKLVETLDQFGLLDEVMPEEEKPYRVYCPACGTPVITQELVAKGCYRCGWLPGIATGADLPTE